MSTWVVLLNGVPIRKYEAPEADVHGNPRKQSVAYDPAVHTRIYTGYAPPTDIGKKEFLFELFTVPERAALLRQFKIADTQANWASDTPTFTEGLFRTLVDAKENLDTIERVRPAHEDTIGFLTLCGYLGVFGSDPANQSARISAISGSITPDGKPLNLPE
jgi:hypothetical protein